MQKNPYSNYVIAISRMKSNCGVTAVKSNIFVQSVAKKPPQPLQKTDQTVVRRLVAFSEK